MTGIEKSFFKWLDTILSSTLPENIVAFDFALYEAAFDFHIQLIGASRYSEDDPDWACDQAFTTGESVFVLPHDVAGEDWKDGLGYATALVTKYLKSGKCTDILTSKAAVGVGFVDGEIQIIYKKQ